MPEGALPGGKPSRALADAFDDTSPVGAEHHWEGRGHGAPVAAGKSAIHRIHARRAQLDEYLAWSRLRHRYLGNHWSLAIFIDDHGTHSSPFCERVWRRWKVFYTEPVHARSSAHRY